MLVKNREEEEKRNAKTQGRKNLKYF